jgi:hypothetical protein
MLLNVFNVLFKIVLAASRWPWGNTTAENEFGSYILATWTGR